MDTEFRYQLVQIRQDQLRAEAEAARLAAIAQNRADRSPATTHTGRPFGALRRLLGAPTSLLAAD